MFDILRAKRRQLILARKLARRVPTAHRLEGLLREHGGRPPMIIVSYNNGAYVENMVAQFQRLGVKPLIIDNASTDAATRGVLSEAERSQHAWVLRADENHGHAVGFMAPFYDLLPEVFGYTDPDLQFHPDMPRDFVETLAALTERFSVFKAGLALDLLQGQSITATKLKMNRDLVPRFEAEYSVREWEGQFWTKRLHHESLEIYASTVDTTFAVYRKANYRGLFWDAVRVAGIYKAIHLPWFPHLDIMSDDERRTYLQNNQSSTWIQGDGN